VRSTFIAGFPSESDADFDRLLSFVREAGLAVAGVFPFDPQEGTAAAALPGRPSRQETAARAAALAEAIETAAMPFWEGQIGRSVAVLVERVVGLGRGAGARREAGADVDGAPIRAAAACAAAIWSTEVRQTLADLPPRRRLTPPWHRCGDTKAGEATPCGARRRPSLRWWRLLRGHHGGAVLRRVPGLDWPWRSTLSLRRYARSRSAVHCRRAREVRGDNTRVAHDAAAPSAAAAPPRARGRAGRHGRGRILRERRERHHHRAHPLVPVFVALLFVNIPHGDIPAIAVFGGRGHGKPTLLRTLAQLDHRPGAVPRPGTKVAHLGGSHLARRFDRLPAWVAMVIIAWMAVTGLASRPSPKA
jgi:hypothetical protein